MKVKDVMHQPLITAPDTSTLDQVARLMWEFDCGIVPVVDAKGRLAGVVTDRDICMAAYTQGRALRDIEVSSCMSRAVIAAHAEDSVDSVEALMGQNQIHRVPVLDAESYLVGMVSMNDLARLTAHSGRHDAEREFVATMAAICAPRHQGDGVERALVVDVTR